MLIYSWFFKQAVTEENMNDAFGAVQSSMFNLMTDQKLVGLAQGGTPGPTTPTANLSIVIGGPTYAYDQLGERIYAPTFSADCSKDLNNVSTAVSGAGNEKYLSVFILFERTLSDPVIDGNGMTVYYVQAESYIYEVYQGAEAPVGTATHPALINPGLLVADVHLIFGQTQIMSGDISTSRAQATFNFAQSPFSILAGNVPDAIEAMLTDLNQHVNSIGTAHPATAISATAVAGSPYALTSGTVESQLTSLLANENSLSSSNNINAPAASGTPFALSSGTVSAQLASLVADLNETALAIVVDDFYYDVSTQTWTPYTITSGSPIVAPNSAVNFTNCQLGDVIDYAIQFQWSSSGALVNVGFYKNGSQWNAAGASGSGPYWRTDRTSAVNTESAFWNQRYICVAGDVGNTVTIETWALGSGSSGQFGLITLHATRRRPV